MSFNTATEADVQNLRKNYHWLLVLGVGLILAGALAVAVPWMATIGVVVTLGMLMLVAGFTQIFGVFNCKGWQGVVLHLLVGILYAVTGFLMLENPLDGAAGITLLLAGFFLASGLMRISVALLERFPGWGWTLLSGSVSLLLGIFIWKQFPESSMYLIGLLLGIDLIVSGWAWVMFALVFRKSIPTEASNKPHGM